MPQGVLGDLISRRQGAPGVGPGAPVSTPEGPPPTPGAPAVPGPAGGADPLSDSLATANTNLQAVMTGQMEITPAAEDELKVMVSLVSSLAQQAQAASQQSDPGGAALSQAGPGTTPAPAPPGPPQLGV